MQGETEAKQSFLRREILEKNYDPEQFIAFLVQQSIEDDLSNCSLQQLQQVVRDFQNQNSLSPDDLTASRHDRLTESVREVSLEKSTYLPKPRSIVYDRFNFAETEFVRKFSCVKIGERLGKSLPLHCEVGNPQRKTVGGFFGIGATSFLEFEVRTPELGWCVGRRYSDFIWLRSHLRKMFPLQVVPPIPEKKASKRTQRHVQKRMRILQYFLNDLLGVPEFLNSRVVEGFLKIKEGPKLAQLKEEADKMKPSSTVNHVETSSGEVVVSLSLENRAYLDEMKRLQPEMERIYKQITRQGKALQSLQTEEVNTLYEMGNLFAELHEKSREVLNRVPKAAGLARLNELFVALNNLTIEWGNLIRGQFGIIEKNFNTFFKYVRNDLHAYEELFAQQATAQEEFCRFKVALDKKRDRLYSLFDPSKWELPKETLTGLSKEVVHDKTQAVRAMLPKETKEEEGLRVGNALCVSQFFENGNSHLLRCAQKFQENFKECSINFKVNTQQIGELWSQMAQSFSGQRALGSLKEKPTDDYHGNDIVDD